MNFLKIKILGDLESGRRILFRMIHATFRMPVLWGLDINSCCLNGIFCNRWGVTWPMTCDTSVMVTWSHLTHDISAHSVTNVNQLKSRIKQCNQSHGMSNVWLITQMTLTQHLSFIATIETVKKIKYCSHLTCDNSKW